VPKEIQEIAAINPASGPRRKTSPNCQVLPHRLARDPELERDQIRLEERQKQLASESFSTLVIKERSDESAGKPYVQVRGDFLTKATRSVLASRRLPSPSLGRRDNRLSRPMAGFTREPSPPGWQ